MTKKQKGKHIHLIGIGGTGLSAIAQVLLDRGFRVSGSDEALTKRTADLYQAGANIFKGHRASNVTGAQMVVLSSAIPEDNPEMQEARRLGIPLLKRGDLLGSLMTNNTGIAITGTHGKTTTTGMVAQILLEAELDPTVIMGGTLAKMDSNGRSGTGKHFVVEADEYDQMFLGLRPKIGVVTNIEYDHPDSYPTRARYEQAFVEFAKLLPDDGCLVICAEDSNAVGLLKVNQNLTRYAYGIGFPITPMPGLNLLLAQDVRPNAQGGVDFSVDLNLEPIGEVSLQVAGDHNVNNALAAMAVALHEGLPFEAIARALGNFPGVERRFELRGQVQGVTVIDDYAHHPTEIKTTLAAVKQRYPGQRLWAVWQPHTYSRVKAMMADFATCFGHADGVVVLDIYRSRERDTLGLTPEGVAKQVKHPNVQYGGALAQATSLLLDQVQANDVVITLNAGDARVMGDWLLDGLRERQAKVVLSLTEDSMGDDKDKGTADEANENDPNKMFKLDATAAQVRRLVDRLKKEEEKKGSTKQDSDEGKN